METEREGGGRRDVVRIARFLSLPGTCLQHSLLSSWIDTSFPFTGNDGCRHRTTRRRQQRTYQRRITSDCSAAQVFSFADRISTRSPACPGRLANVLASRLMLSGLASRERGGAGRQRSASAARISSFSRWARFSLLSSPANSGYEAAELGVFLVLGDGSCRSASRGDGGGDGRLKGLENAWREAK